MNDNTALLAGHPRAALLAAAGRHAAFAGFRTAVVGGFVRDLLLGILSQDIDIAVDGDAIQCAHLLAGHLGGEVVKTSRFGTAALVIGGERIDLAMARRESYPKPGALPLVTPGTLEEDLLRRDFSINAMAVEIVPGNFGRLLDPLGGQEDLAGRVIRILHRDSFRDDPTRLLRAVRLAHRLDFTFAPLTADCFREAVRGRFWLTAGRHRVAREVELFFREDDLPGLLLRLDDYGLFRPLFATTLTGEKLDRVARIPAAAARFADHGLAVNNKALAAMILDSRSGCLKDEATAEAWRQMLPDPGAQTMPAVMLAGLPLSALAYLWILCQNEKEQARLEAHLATRRGRPSAKEDN